MQKIMCYIRIFFKFYFIFTYRGFGFITFGDPSSVEKVLAHGTHELDGKKVSSFLLLSLKDVFQKIPILNIYLS